MQNYNLYIFFLHITVPGCKGCQGYNGCERCICGGIRVGGSTRFLEWDAERRIPEKWNWYWVYTGVPEKKPFLLRETPLLQDPKVVTLVKFYFITLDNSLTWLMFNLI